MIWEDQRKKDEELYPIIEPFVNYFTGKAETVTNVSRKLASHISKRVLSDNGSGTGSNTGTTKKSTDGADGEVISEAEEEQTVDYPNKLFSDESIQNGGFMVYLFCKYNLKSESNS